MIKIADEISSGKILLCDGAWGTELFKLGLKPGECPELWNITNRELVYKIAKSYVDSGADIISTNSFGGSSINLASFGLSDRADEINRIASEISRGAAGPDIHVAGSIGPSGKMILMGEVSEANLYESFSSQAIALEKGGADCAIIETMIDAEELSLAVRAIRENTNLEIIATATYDRTPSGFKTMMGCSIPDMVDVSIGEGVSIIGTNCGHGIDMMVEITKEIRGLIPDIPILVQSNAGIPFIGDNGTLQYPETPEYMASRILDLISAGANIIGGCCGTSPGYIREFRKAIDLL